MFKNIFHIILAILFLPVCYSSGTALYDEFAAIKLITQDQMYLFYGCICYLIFHAVVLKPDKVYIFGHEIMHAIAAILSGGRVHSIKVSKKGGSVTTNKNNIFISLAPYLFPFYAILAASAYFIAGHFVKDVSIYLRPFLFIVGLTLTFHIVLTVDFLKIRQTDLLGTGYFFSIELIYLVNMLILVFIFSLLFKEVMFMRYLNSAIIYSKGAYIAIFTQLFL